MQAGGEGYVETRTGPSRIVGDSHELLLAEPISCQLLIHSRQRHRACHFGIRTSMLSVLPNVTPGAPRPLGECSCLTDQC